MAASPTNPTSNNPTAGIKGTTVLRRPAFVAAQGQKYGALRRYLVGSTSAEASTFAEPRLLWPFHRINFCKLMTAYSVLLGLHSWSRWLVLIFGAWALFRAFTGPKHHWLKPDTISGASFVGSMHLQLLLGLILYFGVSPFGLNAFQQMGGAVMKNSESRFWAVEHLTVMVIAAVCAQVGRTLSKKLATLNPAAARSKALVWFGVALVLVLLMIPWGIWNPTRPLFRF
jgi:hypothetical protein